MVKAIARVAKELAKRKARSAGKFPGKKPKANFVVTSSKTISEGKKTMKEPSRLKQTKKKTLKSELERVKPAWMGAAAGVAGTLAYQELRKGKKSEAKTTKKLKKSIEKHKEKDKKKKEKKHHSR